MLTQLNACTQTAFTCNCPAPYVGPSLANTCGGGAFILFMGLLDNFLRSQCDINDPCGRVSTRQVPERVYDFIVVGAGSAGSVVAARLSEVPTWSVLLIEAGGEEPPGVQVPSMVSNYYGRELDWNFKTEPEKNACQSSPDKRCQWIRGKVLGGSSTINGMVYVRGNPRDFDLWAQAGNDGWNYLEVLPYFKKSEDNLQINELAHEFHGVGGPLPISRFPHTPELAEGILQAGEELGYPRNPDLNGHVLTGISVAQATTKNGVRMSSARSFLRPARDRRNLHILVNTTATRVVVDKATKQAIGVEFVRNGRTEFVRISKEVIVSAGVISSPHLLLLSGIGPKKELEKVGIPVVHNLRGVGKNLNNHIAYPVTFKIKNTSDTFDLDWTSIVDYMTNRKGPMSSTGLNQITGKFNTKYADPSGNNPDLQMFFSGYLANCAKSGAVGEPQNPSDITERRVNFSPVVLQPRSRGYITVNTSDPLAPPLIYANYFSDPMDMDLILEGLKFAMRLGETNVLKTKYGFELDETPVPACKDHPFGSDDYWRCAVTHLAGPEVNHQAGSCRMGPIGDPNAVVDPRLRVQGIQHLRIADASVIPLNISGNTNAAVIMIAEKAADMIKYQWQGQYQLTNRFGEDIGISTVSYPQSLPHIANPYSIQYSSDYINPDFKGYPPRKNKVLPFYWV